LKDAGGHGSEAHAAHQAGTLDALPRIIRNADDDTLLDISRWERQTLQSAMLAHGKTQWDENQDSGSLDPNRPAKAASK
jgi:hypothetical protein